MHEARISYSSMVESITLSQFNYYHGF